MEHAAFAVEDANAVAQRRVAERAEACGGASEWDLGRTRCAGQPACTRARRRAAHVAAGCGCADDSRRRALGGVRGAGTVQCDAAGDAGTHAAIAAQLSLRNVGGDARMSNATAIATGPGEMMGNAG